MFEKLLATGMWVHVSPYIHHDILHYHQLLSPLTHPLSKLLHRHYPPTAAPRQLNPLSALNLMIDLKSSPYHEKNDDVWGAQRVVMASVVVPDHTK